MPLIKKVKADGDSKCSEKDKCYGDMEFIELDQRSLPAGGMGEEFNVLPRFGENIRVLDPNGAGL